MSHETAVSAASAFQGPSETPHVPSPTPTDVTTYAGSGGGDPEPFTGLYDHTDVTAIAKKGTSGVGLERHSLGGHRGKAGAAGSLKGPSLSLSGNHTGKDGRVKGASLSHDGIEGTQLAVEGGTRRPDGGVNGTTGGVNLTKGEFSAGYERDNESKSNPRSTEGSVTFGKDTVRAKAKAFRGGYGASAGAGVRSTVGKPVLMADGRWTVTYDTTSDVSVGGGTKRVTAGVEGAHASGGTRLFASKAEAEAFARGDHAAHSDDPMDLAIGESLVTSNSAKGKLGVETHLGAGLSVGGTHTTTVARLDERTLEVTVARGRDAGGTLSAAAGPIAVGGGLEAGTSEEQRYRFDVTTKAGRAALTQFQATGVAPAANRVGRADSLSVGSSRAAHFAVAGVSTGGKTTERRDRELGNTYTGTRSKGASLLGLGAHSATSSLTSGPGGTDLVSSVKSDEGASSMAELAEATGTRARGMPGSAAVKSSGAWSIESHLSDEQLLAFAHRLASHGDVALAPLRGLDGHGRELRAKLRGAKNMDEYRKAMAEFVAGAGGKATAWVRQLAGVTDYDVKLENDPVFPGAEGRRALEHELTELRDPAAIEAQIAALDARAKAIGDPTKYTDLPLDVRVHEVKKIYAQVEALYRLGR
jgi:hypothetical protein